VPRTPSHETALESARAYLDQDDVEAVASLLRAGSLTSTRARQAFEGALTQATGAGHALALSSPQAAAHLAFHALGAGPGRGVLFPANASEALASVVHLCGAPIEFVDVDAHSGNLDPRALEERLARSPAPTVVVAAHHAGLPCDMEWLIALKRRHDFALLEDASEALGARYRVEGNWVRVGEHPEVELTLLAFGPENHLTTAQGGALLTRDEGFARRLLGHVNHVHTTVSLATERERGGVLRFVPALSEPQAALGVSQLKKLPDFLSARREIASAYLGALRGFVLPHPGGVGEGAEREHAWGRFVLRCAADQRTALRAWLRREGIEAGVPPMPLALEPWFRGRQAAEAYPRACALASTGLDLPLYPSLSNGDQQRVLAALAAWRNAQAAA
jgi:dTDP-4-amino-4,6-dideoxygalactose transaminase